jgi:hypothetical protein
MTDTDRTFHWIEQGITGKEVTSLMRRNGKTIRGLSFAMGITQKRIREVRENGLDERNAIRDWVEAITGSDPGPLPERYRISGRLQEGDCGHCGCPMFNGEYAYEYAMNVFCSVGCCRDSYKFKQQGAPLEVPR